ncbi:hypothetical protein ABKW28_22575 [Nocardioides sp. 31GB23]|uniref:hypothetical protein n=1 Tax=Nocardioides sp. 31GB23 TaxID=3156065 RepID=UPI0032AE98AE
MVAPRGVRKAWWTWKGVGLFVLSVIVLAISPRQDGTDRIGLVAIGVAGVLCSIAVILLWKRDKL